jgi:hypothetical protein
MRKLGCLAFLAALATASSAYSMSYALLPLADGSSAVAADGTIGGSEAIRFLSAMKRAQARGALPRMLIITSPGGSLKSALELGRVVRGLRMKTVVGSVSQNRDGRLTLTAGGCHSACVMVLMAGVDRSVLPGSRVSVHSPQLVLVAGGLGYTVDETTNRYVVQKVGPVLRSYARAMGVSPALIDVANAVPHTKSRALSSSELVRYRLVTSGTTERSAQNSAHKRIPR